MKRHVLPAPHRPNTHQWPDKGLFGAWLGHSTVLLKVDGFTILTDPVFSTRAGLKLGFTTLGLKRLVGPALRSAASAHRPDPAVARTHGPSRHPDTPETGECGDSVVTALDSRPLRGRRYRPFGKSGGERRHRVGPARIRGIEVKHWGARMRTDTYRGYNAYLIEIGNRRIVFGGDTANTDTSVIRSSRPVDLAIMPIGAYNPWIRSTALLSRRGAWDQPCRALSPRTSPDVSFEPGACSRPIERLRTPQRATEAIPSCCKALGRNSGCERLLANSERLQLRSR